jgi:hypothetical protein
MPHLYSRLRHPSDVEVTDDMRTTALARTNDVMGRLDAIRKARELPAEMLPLVAEVFGAEMQALCAAVMAKVEAEEAAKADAERAKFQAEHPRHFHGHPNLAPSEFDGLAGAFASPSRRPGDYGFAPRVTALGRSEPEMVAQREMLPVNSVVYLCGECRAKHVGGGSITVPYKIKPGERMRVTARPQRVAFRPEEISITNGERWTVHDYSIGNRSQFAQAGDVSGAAFDEMTLCGDTAQTAMDVTFDVTYRGPEKDGEQFLATVTGTAAHY